MVKKSSKLIKNESTRLSRNDWVHAALELMCSVGVQGVKVAPLAEQIGITSGSFYWHFKNRRELLDEILEYWEREMTDIAMVEARRFEGTPKDRIKNLMQHVMEQGLARFDLAIWLWAQSDSTANKVFRRAIKKRFNFAAWMFAQAGFSEIEAEARGRLMVTYMMAESTLIRDSQTKQQEMLQLKWEILTNE